MKPTIVNDSEYREAIIKCLERYRVMADDLWIGPHTEPNLLGFIDDAQACSKWLPITKLNRWLGYIQGTLIAQGKTTVQIERDWTRPLFKHLDA